MQKTLYGTVDIRFIDEAFLYSFRQRTVIGTALQICSAQDGGGRGGCRIGMGLVSFVVVEVADGAAIRYDDAVVTPFPAEYMVQQPVTAATRFTLKAVVGTHHFFYFSFFYQGFKRREIGFIQVARTDVLRIETVAVPFGAGMYGKMFGASVYFVILLVFVQALQAFHDADTHYACQIRVFSIGFYAASPARVTVDIDGGSPDCQSLIALVASFCGICGILGAGFIGYGDESGVQGFGRE